MGRRCAAGSLNEGVKVSLYPRFLRGLRQLALATLVAAPAAAFAFDAVCNGKMFNPVADVDWNQALPITVAGARVQSGVGTNPVLMEAMPPVCVCPSILFGIPLPGIGVTYWEPLSLIEVERRPGCLSSLGGLSVLPSFGMLHSEVQADEAETSQTSRMQIHQYQYPLFSMLNVLPNTWCRNAGSFELGYMTEIDYLWQDDMWGGVLTPETALFANPIAQAACTVDAVAANLNYPLDALFWCAGSWGGTYPLTGNSGHGTLGFTRNNQLAAKFIARTARLGLEWQTIGPTAICTAHPNPVIVKSQYRFDQVQPIPRFGRSVTLGSLGLGQVPPVENVPTQEHTVNLIWQGKQCCLKVIP